jgi:glyoxylase-like metal-dependent hydrolase (beta-lactamase superfamily II)
MRALWSIAALAALLMLAQPLAAQTPADPVVKTEGLRQVSPHIYIIPDNSVPLVPNVGFVIGERGILVIDTGLGPRNGSAVLEVAKELGGSRALYLVTTHFHPEHDLGAQVFPESTTLIRSNDQAKDIAEFGLQLAQVFARR